MVAVPAAVWVGGWVGALSFHPYPHRYRSSLLFYHQMYAIPLIQTVCIMWQYRRVSIDKGMRYANIPMGVVVGWGGGVVERQRWHMMISFSLHRCLHPDHRSGGPRYRRGHPSDRARHAQKVRPSVLDDTRVISVLPMSYLHPYRFPSFP